MCQPQGTKQEEMVLKEILDPRHFSCLELAQMGIPGFPTTEQGWGKVVAREHWPWVEVQAKGGKKGIKRVYSPPAALLEAIRRHKEGEEVTSEEIAIARARRRRQLHSVWTLNEQGRYTEQVAAHHNMDRTKSLTRLMAQALSAGFTRAIFLAEAGQAELLMLGNSTIARLEEESARRLIELDALVGDAEILDTALRLEWLLMQREPQASQISQP